MMESFAAARARVDRVMREQIPAVVVPRGITVLALDGTVKLGIPRSENWVISSEKLGFEWHQHNGDYTENAYFADEGSRWIRGFHAADSAEVLALQVAAGLT